MEEKYKSEYQEANEFKECLKERCFELEKTLNKKLDKYSQLSKKKSLDTKEYIKKYKKELKKQGILNSPNKIIQKRDIESTLIKLLENNLEETYEKMKNHQKSIKKAEKLEREFLGLS